MFERGLPGYDSWLDNHGNPGIWEGEMDFSWALEEQIDVTQIGEAVYRISRVSASDSFELSFDHDAEAGRSVLINGEFEDLGEDTIAFISIIDQYHEDGGEPGKTLRQEPFEDVSE